MSEGGVTASCRITTLVEILQSHDSITKRKWMPYVFNLSGPFSDSHLFAQRSRLSYISYSLITLNWLDPLTLSGRTSLPLHNHGSLIHSHPKPTVCGPIIPLYFSHFSSSTRQPVNVQSHRGKTRLAKWYAPYSVS